MIGSCIYPLITVSIKISILCLYRRIFATQMFRRVSSCVGLVDLVWFVAIELGSIMTCIPVAKFWDPTISGTCINFNLLFPVYSIIETILDFVVSRHNKIILSGMFLLGELYIFFPSDFMQNTHIG